VGGLPSHPLLVPFFSLLFPPFPPPLPLEVEPPIAARGSGEALKYIAEPQPKLNLVHFSLKIWHLVATKCQLGPSNHRHVCCLHGFIMWTVIFYSNSSLIGLLLYYDAVLPMSLKRPVRITVTFYCNQSTGGEGAELSCGGAKYWGGG